MSEQTMSKEKQIEEMKEVIRQETESCKTCDWYKEGLCIETCEFEEGNQKICETLYNAGYRKQSEVIEEYRKKVYSKMEKYVVFGREYIQRIMREVEKEMKGGAE